MEGFVKISLNMATSAETHWGAQISHGRWGRAAGRIAAVRHFKGRAPHAHGEEPLQCLIYQRGDPRARRGVAEQAKESGVAPVGRRATAAISVNSGLQDSADHVFWSSIHATALHESSDVVCRPTVCRSHQSVGQCQSVSVTHQSVSVTLPPHLSLCTCGQSQTRHITTNLTPENSSARPLSDVTGDVGMFP
jgi:hypothetical protein